MNRRRLFQALAAACGVGVYGKRAAAAPIVAYSYEVRLQNLAAYLSAHPHGVPVFVRMDLLHAIINTYRIERVILNQTTLFYGGRGWRGLVFGKHVIVPAKRVNDALMREAISYRRSI